MSLSVAAVQPLYRGATGVSTCFGTFGELLQGALPGAHGDFLVTLPVARWSMATFQVDTRSTDVQVRPAGKHKALRLCRMLLASIGAPVGGVLTIDSSLPEGKGLASSSADLVACARAVANAVGRNLSTRHLEDLLRRIEPTDGVMYPGVVAFHHRQVRLRQRLGSLPTMTIVGVDEGGTVDTVSFNSTKKPYSRGECRDYARLLDRMANAVAGHDLAEVGAVATRSAVLNQGRCPKRILEPMLRLRQDVDGLGVVAAHSGTMLGILLDPQAPGYGAQLAATVAACRRLSSEIGLYRSLSFDW